ncbi:hypothetical protein [Pseudoxanthomonas sp. z9]|uniref:hypothetical protein n=1 Tax=Pseudoxanthomonas sp. z9 TaxID=2584942 RepID=UPI00114257B5|nr:hypothetical protein [Pseudoxanthomonas sp. z9]MCL6713594.1 hypothetical protein [Pseudomonas sp. R2.Fl]
MSVDLPTRRSASPFAVRGSHRVPAVAVSTLLRAGALGLLALLAACGGRERVDAETKRAEPASPPPAIARVREWNLPAPIGAAQPDLVIAPDGRRLLSWVEPAAGEAHRLRLAWAGQESWQAPITIAEGNDWFLNWADTPHVQALPDGSLWAHWLRSTGPSRMDYGIDLVRSGDGGRSWSAPQLVHPAGTRGDHGFVTFWTQAPDQLGIAWLDSRQKAAADHSADAGHDDAHHGGGGAMMLRAALYGAQARQLAEWPLDASTCDCCTTASAITDRGVVVVYRGRTAGEIRDTRIVRFDGQAWTAPRDVHTDGWHMPACPVNGPVVAARGNEVWVAWYTEAGGVPELRAAHSGDAGDHFDAPVTLARGGQVLGRLGLALGDDRLLASWLEETGAGNQRIVLGTYDSRWQSATRVEVATLAARGRASGMPRLRWADGAAWLVWTDVDDGKPRLKGASVR